MVYFLKFLGDVDALWAVFYAVTTPDAMIGLSQLGNAVVITHEEGLAGALVVAVFLVAHKVPFFDALVVMHKDGRDIDAVRAGHTILAVVTGDGLESHYLVGNLLVTGFNGE